MDDVIDTALFCIEGAAQGLANDLQSGRDINKTHFKVYSDCMQSLNSVKPLTLEFIQKGAETLTPPYKKYAHIAYRCRLLRSQFRVVKSAV